MLLSAVGVYGVLSFTVGQRTKEIAVRVALGSTSERVARLVVSEGMRLAAVGLMIGVAAALALGRVVESMLFQIQPSDPASFGIAVAMIVSVALLAGWLPARRATSVDAASVLRAE